MRFGVGDAVIGRDRSTLLAATAIRYWQRVVALPVVVGSSPAIVVYR